MKTRIAGIAAAGLLTGLAAGAGAAPYGGVARRLAREAAEAGVERLAVLPFEPLSGGSVEEGRHIAELLTDALAGRGEIAVVERAALRRVVKEQALEGTGLLDPRGRSRLGRLLQAQAVVTGSFVVHGDEVRVSARLVALETGLVLAAAAAEEDRNGFLDRPSALAGLPLALAPAGPRRSTAPPPARGADSCSEARRRADALQAGILPLKARHWAAEIAEGRLTHEQVSSRVGARLGDPELRADFERLLRRAAAGRPAPLSEAELQRFNTADAEAFVLRLGCGLQANAGI